MGGGGPRLAVVFAVKGGGVVQTMNSVTWTSKGKAIP